MATSQPVDVDARVYDLDIVNKAAYSLSDLAFFRIGQRSPSVVSVDITPLPGVDEDDLIGRFNNALVDFRIRMQLSRETATIRDLIFRQAFVEGDLEA